ncbi:MAG: fumarylacetoacetate hydrolase family protein, partial [Cyanobacteria bacterium REEB65]|nr:fumarylacetoacetate hydrolase family protein [Cyanobacteria bacterium REEB65]
LDDAVRLGQPIPMLSLEGPLTAEQGYEIQELGIELRLARGERLAGMKMGLTSLAKMRQMGVHTPIYGHLTDAMLLPDGGILTVSDHCHPRVEPEIAFLLGQDLPGPVSPAQALAAVAGACCALEIIDSRYRDFQFKLADVVADNASSARFVLGNRLLPPDRLDLGCLGMVMEIDAKPVEIGCSAAIYEHPARSLAELANMLARRGKTLRAGQIVLAGGATAAVALQAGQRVRLEVDGLGCASFSCTPTESARCP